MEGMKGKDCPDQVEVKFYKNDPFFQIIIATDARVVWAVTVVWSCPVKLHLDGLSLRLTALWALLAAKGFVALGGCG